MDDFEISSGNVFADLGLPNPQERLVKASLAMRISARLTSKKLGSQAAADLLGIDQAQIIALSKGQLAHFSVAQLSQFFDVLT